MDKMQLIKQVIKPLRIFQEELMKDPAANLRVLKILEDTYQEAGLVANVEALHAKLIPWLNDRRAGA